MSKQLTVIYQNIQANPRIESQQIEQFHALQRVYAPDILLLDECREASVSELAPHTYHVDSSPAAVNASGDAHGITVVSRFDPKDIAITRKQSWEGDPVENSRGTDARELVRVEVPYDNSRLAVYADHQFHYHDLRHPEYALKRPQQSRTLRDTLIDEAYPYVWLSDTNTFFAGSVRTALERRRSGAVLLPHCGEGNQRTWRPIGPFTNMLRSVFGIDVGYVISIDRAAAHEDIAHLTTLQTLPHVIDGVENPSDHRPIMLQIQIAS